MGANGAVNVNMSGGGDGFNMAAMMASMAVDGQFTADTIRYDSVGKSWNN